MNFKTGTLNGEKSKGKPMFKNKEHFHVLIALLLSMSVLFLLPATNGLTRQGIVVLSIVVPTIYMWLFVNTHWVSLLFLGLLGITEIMTPNQIWAGSLGHFTITLVLTFSILSECLNETGAIKKISTWFITRPFVQSKPYAFMAMFFASNIIIGMVMQNLALAVMYVALTAKICEDLEIKKGESMYTCLMLGTFWTNSVISIASPIAKTLPNILIGLVYTTFGVQITYAQWFMIGVPFSIVMFGVVMLCIRLSNPDTTKIKNFDIELFKKDDVPLSKRGKIALWGMMALIAIVIFPELFLAMDIFVPVSSYFARIGSTVPAIIIIIALSLIRVEENNNSIPVLDFAQTAKSVPINLLIFVAAVVIMGTPIASEASGIVPWIHNMLYPITSGLPVLGVVVMLIIISTVLTNFLSNTVVMTLAFHMGVTILAYQAINPIVVAVLIAFAACMACLTPSSALTAPLFYGPEHIKVREAMKDNVIFVILSIIVVIALTPLTIAVLG